MIKKSNNQINISLLCVTLNRAKKLNRMLSVVSPYVGECIIIDGGSVDQTKEICDFHNAKMYTKKWENDCAKQRKYGLSKCTKHWRLILDDDEYPDIELMEKLIQISKTREIKKCYNISRRNYYRFDGLKKRENLFKFPDYQMRFISDGVNANNEKVHIGIDTQGCSVALIEPKYGIIHEKTWEDQNKANILYEKIEKG